MSSKGFKGWMEIIVIGILGVSALAYVILATYQTVNPAPTEPILFNITGIVNVTNATTIISIHFECIKFCQQHEISSHNDLKMCYDQCSLLGQECNV